ncbi:hydrogenase 1 large subunit [Shigella sonnei]|nr:hydrogenase 1 large subunit [Shigella sonnei]
MSTQYETQGYTINNAGRRLVVDPITRIEGHMRCEVNINDQNVITNAVSCGTMFRGLEIILQGRDPRDAWAFVERICGVCTSSATLCWQRSGATIIWCTSISLPGWTGSMC